MQELIALLDDRNVITFILLFVKMSVVIGFFPYFNFTSFSNNVKAPLVLLLTLVFYPMTPLYSLAINLPTVVMAVFFEVLFGFIAAFLLRIVFDVVAHASELISLTMGLSMASVFDPLTQNQSTVIGQVFSLVAILVFLSFGGDHLIILFAHHSLSVNPIGTIDLGSEVGEYILLQMKNFFVIGFSMAFPVLAVGLLGDLIFGMLMKTVPQFNLLVLGFPIKIALSTVVILAVFASVMILFENMFLEAYNGLGVLYQ